MWGVVGCARIDEGALRGDFNGLIHLREGEDFSSEKEDVEEAGKGGRSYSHLIIVWCEEDE